MGIPLLWIELYEHAHEVNLKNLHVFLTKDGKAASKIRLGIDISAWMKHALAGKEYLLLRTIFYRLCKLASLPYLNPIFVFDGLSRPSIKRGKKTPFSRTPSGRNLFGNLEMQVRQLVEAFGFVLLQAPGEAEAELSDLNKRGLIDAILSDDSDCFLFGAKVVVRNWGEKLAGTTAIQSRRAKVQASKRASSPSSSQSSQYDVLSSSDDGSEVKVGSSSKQNMFADKSKQGDQVYVYRVEDFAKGVNVASCVLLIGLLGGGDYDVNGVRNCGIRTAIGLAKGGFDERLLKGVKKYMEPPATHTIPPRIKSEVKWQEFLHEWKEDVKEELRTNASGNLIRRQLKLANSDAISNLLTTTESMTVLSAYVWPTISNLETIPEQKAFDIQQVAKVACTLLNWNREYTQKTFRKNLFLGHLLQWFNGMHNNRISATPISQLDLYTPSSKPVASTSKSPSKSSQSPSKGKKKVVHGRDLRSMFSTSTSGSVSSPNIAKALTEDVIFEILKERESEVYVEFNIVKLAESVEIGIDEGTEARVDDNDGVKTTSISEEDELESSAPSETNDTQITPRKAAKPFDQFDPIRLWFPLEVLLLKEEGVLQYEEFKNRKIARDKVENERKTRQEKKKSFDESQQRLSNYFRSEKISYKPRTKENTMTKAETSKSDCLIDAIDNAFSHNSPTASPSKRKAIKTPHASSSTSCSLSGSEEEAERTVLAVGTAIQGSDDSVEFVRVKKNISNKKGDPIIILD